MDPAVVKRPIDLLVANWAVPVFTAAGFKRKHRVFTATGQHGVHLRVEFRLYSLPVRCDTFWFEWTASSQHDQRALPSRVPIPPAMSLDSEYTAVFPPESVIQHVDLWRVGATTVQTYGPQLVDQIGRFMPYWHHLLAQVTPEPPEDIWECASRLRPPPSELAHAIAEKVVAGRAGSVAQQIRQLAAQYPNNAWTLWWQGLPGS